MSASKLLKVANLRINLHLGMQDTMLWISLGNVQLCLNVQSNSAFFLYRILDDLHAQGLIKQLTTMVQHGTLSQTVD